MARVVGLFLFFILILKIMMILRRRFYTLTDIIEFIWVVVSCTTWTIHKGELQGANLLQKHVTETYYWWHCIQLILPTHIM